MNSRSLPRATHDRYEARRQVQAYCQTLVDAGFARWRIDDGGTLELHLQSGQIYLLREPGILRLR